MIKKLKNILSRTNVRDDPNGEDIVRTFYKKELQKIRQTEFRTGKVNKRKGDKLYVKWKGSDIPKKDIVI